MAVDDWQENGGEGSIEYLLGQGSFIILTKPRVHRKLERTLAGIRAARKHVEQSTADWEVDGPLFEPSDYIVVNLPVGSFCGTAMEPTLVPRSKIQQLVDLYGVDGTKDPWLAEEREEKEYHRKLRDAEMRLKEAEAKLAEHKVAELKK